MWPYCWTSNEPAVSPIIRVSSAKRRDTEPTPGTQFVPAFDADLFQGAHGPNSLLHGGFEFLEKSGKYFKGEARVRNAYQYDHAIIYYTPIALDYVTMPLYILPQPLEGPTQYSIKVAHTQQSRHLATLEVRLHDIAFCECLFAAPSYELPRMVENNAHTSYIMNMEKSPYRLISPPLQKCQCRTSCEINPGSRKQRPSIPAI